MDLGTGGDLVDAVVSGAPAGEIAARPLPAYYRAAYLSKADVGLFVDVDGRACGPPACRQPAREDVRRSIHIGEVPMPPLAPDEVLIAVMAAAVNQNTVRSALFEPVPTFAFLARHGRHDRWARRDDLPYHVVGSDAAGVVVRVGDGVRRWSVGQHVVVNAAYVDHEDPAAHDGATTSGGSLVWGEETNFGAFADFAVAKASQLLPKPPHLSWEEASCVTLCAGTAYRMLVGGRGAAMRQGEVVLVWGAAGGLGGYAVQLVRNGGGIPVGVVGSAARAELARELGCAGVVNRHDIAEGAPADDGFAGPKSWRRLGEEIRRQVGEDPHIVVEHTGRETFGASVYVVRRGGTIVTCGSSTGYRHEYDNRHLCAKVKRIVGGHGADYDEAWQVNRLVTLGMLVPTLARCYALPDAGEAVRAVHLGRHAGKTAVRCLAPSEGLGITDPAARRRIGERRLRLFREA